MDLRVVLFTIALGFLTALAFGLLPALRATRLDLAQSIKDGAPGSGYRRSRLRSALVVTQVAASVALLALAAVFMRGSQRSGVSERAENLQRVLTVAVDLELLGVTDEAGQSFQAAAMERLRLLPGVEAVALAPIAPAKSIPPQRVALPEDTEDQQRYYETAVVRGDWFAIRDTRPVMGRLFTAAELQSGAPVAVVDVVAATELWPEQDALGQTLLIGEGDNAIASTVIGVIPTIRDRNLHNDDGVITVPGRRGYVEGGHFYLRTRGNAADLRTAVREVMRQLDPRLPPAQVATLGEALHTMAAPTTQLAWGVGAMGTIALLLAALGLSAVLAFIIEQRRFEIGVRMALGARATSVVGMVVRQSLVLALIGIVIGGVGAGMMATLMRGILFGLPPLDPLAFGGSTALILAVALLSSAAPARRAARVDPLVALRVD